MDKVALGIPAYGLQGHQWWAPLVQNAADYHKSDIEITNVLTGGGMTADVNRNYIVDEFKKTAADWMLWIDTDNVHPVWGLRRLLDTKKTLVTGVYVKRSEENPQPLLYIRTPDGGYAELGHYRPGEILPIDAAGVGACLMHRSVFEDVEKAYRVLGRREGGITLVHKDAIIGDIFDGQKHEYDGCVTDGVLHDRLVLPNRDVKFPFFMIEYGRTEDYGFFERAQRAGHQLYVDTSVEVGHIGVKNFKVSDWRANERHKAKA